MIVTNLGIDAASCGRAHVDGFRGLMFGEGA